MNRRRSWVYIEHRESLSYRMFCGICGVLLVLVMVFAFFVGLDKTAALQEKQRPAYTGVAR